MTTDETTRKLEKKIRRLTAVISIAAVALAVVLAAGASNEQQAQATLPPMRIIAGDVQENGTSPVDGGFRVTLDETSTLTTKYVVQFDRPFEKLPVVVASIRGTSQSFVLVDAVTKNGFDAHTKTLTANVPAKRPFSFIAYSSERP
jgi:hypothetical protein